MRPILAFLTLLLAVAARGETEYLGLYLQGSKIGYAEYTVRNEPLNGKALKRSDSKTVMDAGLLGTAMSLEMRSTMWSTPQGRPVRMLYDMSSGGRGQKLEAVFGAESVAIKIDNNGRKTDKKLPIPKGATIVDDPVSLVLSGAIAPGAAKPFFVLDPVTATFIKNEVKFLGKAKTAVGGKSVDANLIEIKDPRASMRVFVSAKGDLIRIEGPMGIEMVPVTKAVALAAPGKYAPSVDLAYATSLKTDKPIGDPASLTGLKLRITAKNLEAMPSGQHQTAKKEGESWVVDVHPTRIADATGGTIEEAKRQKPEWTKPSLHIPSDASEFKQLAQKIVGDRKDVRAAATAIQKWVFSEMKANAGIGVLRDASEVLKTKEGVCRDYAILTTTLLRAAGIPARLASGLVNWDGTFYYHAWAEAWDGTRWIGIDSTTDREQISAAHVKLGEGQVEDAFTFTFLDRAKIEVLDARRTQRQ